MSGPVIHPDNLFRCMINVKRFLQELDFRTSFPLVRPGRIEPYRFSTGCRYFSPSIPEISGNPFDSATAARDDKSPRGLRIYWCLHEESNLTGSVRVVAISVQVFLKYQATPSILQNPS
jgi:hypothetical protein